MTKDESSSDQQYLQSLWATIADREALLLALVESTAQIVWVTDKEGNVLEADPPQNIANLTWSAFTGLSQASLRGRGWAAAIHPDDVRTIASITKEARQTGNPLYCEFRLRHKSGEWRWIICRGNAVRKKNGEIAGWIGSCTDITTVKKTEAALRDSQQRLLAALEAGEMSTWIWRLTDNTFWWDDAGEKLWGLTHNDNMSHNLDDLSTLIHPEDRPAVQRAISESLTSGVARGVEFRTVRTDGKLQWLSSRGRLDKDAAGNPAQIVGVFVDVTKLKTAEESLRQAQKMQALGTLAGGIAHDFNNVLLAIAGNTRLAIGDVDANHPARASLDEVMKASTRATDLVRRILAFSSRAPREATTTPLLSGVQEALDLVRLSVPQNIVIDTRFADTSLNVALGATELHQVMINLITNAVHAIGNQSGTIEVSLARDGDHARIVVRDTGCGMDEATQMRVFEPFFTTKPTGQGTGLGLAVVHGIVQSAHGMIGVDSKLGSGSAFTLHLPVAPAGSIPNYTPTIVASQGRGERILYVDDDDAVVLLIERTLQLLGYDVSGYSDATLAVQAFAADPLAFDVVVTDLSMPGMNGFEVARAIKHTNSTTPIVLTSGYVRSQDREQAAALGIDHVILKPNTIDELGQVLDTLCKQLRAQRSV